MQLESAIWRIDSGESLTLAFTKQSSDCSLALMSSAASCNDRWIASLSSSSRQKRPLLPRCLRGDGDDMLVLQRLSMAAHRVCESNQIFCGDSGAVPTFSCAQPNFVWLQQQSCNYPLGSPKFSCPTRFCVVKTASRVTVFERGQQTKPETWQVNLAVLTEALTGPGSRSVGTSTDPNNKTPTTCRL